MEEVKGMKTLASTIFFTLASLGNQTPPGDT